MTLTVGNKLPQATLIRIGDNGPEQVQLRDRLGGRKVVIFGLPGAFTPTCSSVHVPGFVATAAQFGARGVDEIICIAVNDAYVMAQWAAVTGGEAAGIRFLADADGSFTRAIGMQYDAPAVGMFGRSKRYSMLVDDGVVQILNMELVAGTCKLTGGDALLDQV